MVPYFSSTQLLEAAWKCSPSSPSAARPAGIGPVMHAIASHEADFAYQSPISAASARILAADIRVSAAKILALAAEIGHENLGAPNPDVLPDL